MLTLVTLLAFGSPSLAAPARPPIELAKISGDTLVITSLHRIESVELRTLCERYHYFVEVSSDGRSATVLLRTAQDPVKVVVTCGQNGTARTVTREFTIRNNDPK